MLLPSVRDFDVAGKRVLLRTNYDVPLIRQEGKKAGGQEGPTTLKLRGVSGKAGGQERWEVEDGTRIEESVKTIELLFEKGAEKIIIASHLGRPGGRVWEELSLEPVAHYLRKRLDIKQKIQSFRFGSFLGYELNRRIVVLENLRYWPEEEGNDNGFAKALAGLADVYVNDAFAGSHRKHASIVGVPRYLPAAFGLDMIEEVETLRRVREQPRRPVVLLLGGAKKSKMESAKRLITWVDWVLVGGKLIEEDGLPELLDHPKIEGNLLKSGQDITIETAEKFAGIIAQAGTVVWAGPMGNFYEEDAQAGTRIVGEAVAKSSAFSVVGGGDTEAALTRFGLVDKIDYISSGGGAMLEFLAEGSLPGIEVIVSKN